MESVGSQQEGAWRPAPGRRDPPDTQSVLIVTMNEIPGYWITQVGGDVFGLTVKACNYFSNLGASFQTLVGGEAIGCTKLLADSRNRARKPDVARGASPRRQRHRRYAL
jgi:Putative heavy-metal-binding